MTTTTTTTRTTRPLTLSALFRRLEPMGLFTDTVETGEDDVFFGYFTLPVPIIVRRHRLEYAVNKIILEHDGTISFTGEDATGIKWAFLHMQPEEFRIRVGTLEGLFLVPEFQCAGADRSAKRLMELKQLCLLQEAQLTNLELSWK